MAALSDEAGLVVGGASPSTTSLAAVVARLRRHHATATGEASVTAGAATPPDPDRAAGVLVALFERNGVVRVMLTERSSKLRTHSGEVSLPGGKFDKVDGNLVRTALREAEEEIALPQSVPVVVCLGDTAISKHGLLVLPVIAVIPEDFKPSCNEAEVAASFTCPLDTFLQSEGHMHKDITWSGMPFRMHFFNVTERRINGTGERRKFLVWGLTAHVLVTAARIAFGREPDFERAAPGGPDRGDVTFSRDGHVMVRRRGTGAAGDETAGHGGDGDTGLRREATAATSESHTPPRDGEGNVTVGVDDGGYLVSREVYREMRERAGLLEPASVSAAASGPTAGAGAGAGAGHGAASAEAGSMHSEARSVMATPTGGTPTSAAAVAATAAGPDGSGGTAARSESPSTGGDSKL